MNFLKIKNKTYMDVLNPKIKSLEELSPIIKKLKWDGEKVVLSHGTFDLIHHGHFNYLKESKKLGDILVVSLVADEFLRKGLKKPIFNENIRADSLASLEYVDYVVLCRDFGAWEIIKTIKPDIYTKGEEASHQLKNPMSGVNKDMEAIRKAGGEFRFTKSIPVQTTDIFNAYSRSLPADVVSFFEQFKGKYNIADIILKIEQLSGMKVLVIGETIIDEYRFMSPLLGKANKASAIAAQYNGKEEHAGGAVALANHVAGICKNVSLLTYLGKSKPREGFIRKSLHSNVKPVFCYALNQPTIIKRRFVDESNYAKFFEEHEFSKEFLPSKEEERVKKYLEENLKKYDLVITIDYGHGFISKRLIDTIIAGSKFLALNAQTNSGNVGFNYITKYPRADYVCLDELEARLATHDEISGIEQILKDSLYMKLKPKKMVVTLGHRGSLAYEKESGFVRTPAIPTNVTDPIGAGDAFLGISAPCAAAGFPLDLVAFIGGVASSVAVSILGNKTSVKRDDLFRVMGSLLS